MDIIYSVIGTPLGFIMWAFYLVVHNFGISIILFTIVARLAMFPLNLKQQKNMAHSQLFAPRVQEIQTKYRNDKARMQEELAKLQKEGYNPMGGCAPILVTLVVLFGILDVVYRPMTHIEHIDRIEAGSIANLVGLARQTETAETILAESADGRAVAYYKANKSFAGYETADTASQADTANTASQADTASTASQADTADTASQADTATSAESNSGTPATPTVPTASSEAAVLPTADSLTYNDVITFGIFSAAQLDDLMAAGSPLTDTAKKRLKTLGTQYAGMQRELYAITQYSKHPAVFAEVIKNPEVLAKCKELQGNMSFAGVNLGERPELRFYPGMIVVVLAFIFSLTQAIVTLVIQKKTMPPQMNNMATMKIMMFISPVMSLFITFQFPLGAGLYWSVSYIVGVAQSLILYKFWHPEKLKEQVRLENEKKTVKYQTVVDAVIVNDGDSETDTKQVRLSEMSQRQQKDYYRKKLEEAHRADEEKYGTIPDDLSFGDVVTDTDDNEP